MNIQKVKELNLGIPTKYIRSVPVKLGRDEEGLLFLYSASENVDPGEEYYHHPSDTLKITVFDKSGTRLWTKDLGGGVIPGVWFCPLITFDLDNDGIDEIYYLNNINPDRPFSFVYRKLEALDPNTGECIGRWDWPQNTFDDRLSLSYRFYLLAGYSHGEPVLVTSQGTYGDMFLQGWGSGMVKKWDIKIPKDVRGPKASHITPVLDFNNDGIDEILWGERMISIETGEELLCFDKSYDGHSDVIIPFLDFDHNELYLYTCREGGGAPRVVTFKQNGDIAWSAIDEGHMHDGWLATFGDKGNYTKIAMAIKNIDYFGETKREQPEPIVYYFDAFTGKPADIKLPVPGWKLTPLDINGDGYSEFYEQEKGVFLDRFGNEVAKLEKGKQVRNGKIFNEYAGEQIMLYDDQGMVSVYADLDAVESDYFKKRHAYKNYLFNIQHLMASGYNHHESKMTAGI